MAVPVCTPLPRTLGSPTISTRPLTHADPLVPITDLIKRHLSPLLKRTFLELGGGEGRFNLAERMKGEGWDATGLGRAAVQASTYTRVEDYRTELLNGEPSLASVVVARLSFYPRLSNDSPRVYPWDQCGLDKAGLTDLCADQYLADPMVFPIRRALEPNGIFIRTMRAEGIGTIAEIPDDIMRRSGFMIEDKFVEEFEGTRLHTTAYRAIPLLDFGRAVVHDVHGELFSIPYEQLLRKVLDGEIGLRATREEDFTLWHVQTPTASPR